MSEAEFSQVPQRVDGKDARALELDVRERLVLLSVDGRSSVAQIADVVAMDAPQVQEILNELIGIDLIRWIEQPGLARTRTLTPEKPPIALAQERLNSIDAFFVRIQGQDHYGVLGVKRDADAKEIRASYFKLSKQYHPDALYGKNFGEYRDKMEAVFKRVTEAYETLRKEKNRADYDIYLRAQERMRELESRIQRGNQEVEEFARQVRSSDPVAAAAGAQPPNLTHQWRKTMPPPQEQGSLDDIPSEIPATPHVPATPPPVSPSPLPPNASEAERMARKRAVWAKRLRPGMPTPQPPSPSPLGNPQTPSGEPPSSDVFPRERLRQLAQSLKASSVLTGGMMNPDRHLSGAKSAELRGDIVGAANALRKALTLAPHRKDIEDEFDRLNQLVQAELANMHETQAKYEEDNKKWTAAAVSWAKVVEGRPDDLKANMRAANSLLLAGLNLHRARDYAQKAVMLKADSLDARALLTRVYIQANMKASAEKALVDTEKLDPKGKVIGNLQALFARAFPDGK